MELSIEELFKGKKCLIKNNEYWEPEAYVTPFLERMSKFTDDFRIQARLPECLSVDAQNGEDRWYTRVWIQAVLPDEYAYENHVQSVSLLYALDTRKPIAKIFKNTINQACLNMCVFSPEHLEVQEMKPETALNYKFTDGIMERADKTRSMLERLAQIEYKKEQVYNDLGLWVDRCITSKFDNGFGKVKLAESLPIAAYKNLFYNEESPYYTKDGNVDGFTVYNSFTDLISNDKGKDIVNKFEKIYLVSQIMGL